MSIKKGLIGVEDLELGDSTYNRIGKTGTSIQLNQINVGSITRGSVSKVANYTALPTDDIIYVDCTSGAFTITLFSTSDNDKKSVLIYKSDKSANILTIAGTIEGLTNLSMKEKSLIELVSNGTEFKVLSSEGLVY